MTVHGHTFRALTGALLSLVLVAACTSEGSSDADEKPTAPRLEAPDQSQLAEDVRLGDQTDQSLFAVDTHDESAVAVGYAMTESLQRPLVATSSDGGESWQQGEVDPETVPEETGNAVMFDVAAGEGQFVATGWTENGPPGVWSSEDGTSWQMHELDPEVFGPRDSIEAIVWSDGRYYAAGTNSRSAGKSTNRPIVWTSEGGQTWTRVDLARTVRGLTGSIDVDDVAVQGDQVLVVGGVEDNNNSDQLNGIVLWMSKNAGRSFERESTPSTLGGDYRAYAAAAHADGGNFHIAASGDGLSEGNSASWDGVVVTQRSGGWTTVQDRAMSSPDDERPSTIFKVDDRWALAANLGGTRGDARVYLGHSYEALDKVRSPSLNGRGEQVVEDGASVDRHKESVGLLVGSSSRSGSMEPMIWRLRGKKLQPVTLPKEISAGAPTVYATALVHTGTTYLGLGNVADSPVTWSSDDFRSWTPEGLPGRDEKVPYVDLFDGVRRPDGGVLAVGSRAYGDGQDVMVWLRYPEGNWQEKRSVDLAERSDGGYGSTTAASVAIKGKKAVIAASRFINGREEIRPFFSEDGGESWEAGEGTRQTELSDDEEHSGFTEYPAFRAPVNGSAAANAVVKTPGRWVIGGERSEAGTGDRPAVWLSRDGERWQEPQRLPMPKGAYGASVDQLINRGAHVVALGSMYHSESDPEPGWVSWTSADGGRTWKVGFMHDEPGFVADVVMTKDRFYAVGGRGEGATRDAALWASEDGREWEPVDLDLEHGDGRGRQYFSSAVVVGDELHVLVADVSVEGGGVFAETMPLP